MGPGSPLVPVSKLPSDPPREAKLFDVEDLPVARVPGEAPVSYAPDLRPYEGSMMLALPVSRELWDELRAHWASLSSTA